LGRTVENTLRPNTKKGITKEQHITNLKVEIVGLLKNTLKTKQKKGNHKGAASLNPCFHR
jgi:hypothetical protein